MTISYNWSIDYMQTKQQEDGYTNVVVTAGWICTAIDVNNNISASVSGCCGFPAPSANFTAYDDLTQQQVLDWCWTSGGTNREEVETSALHELQQKSSPPIVELPLPW